MGSCFGNQRNKTIFWLNQEFKSKNMKLFYKQFWDHFKEEQFQIIQIIKPTLTNLEIIKPLPNQLVFIISNSKMKPEVTAYLQTLFPQTRKFLHLFFLCQDFQESKKLESQQIIQNCVLITPKFQQIVIGIEKIIIQQRKKDEQEKNIEVKQFQNIESNNQNWKNENKSQANNIQIESSKQNKSQLLNNQRWVGKAQSKSVFHNRGQMNEDSHSVFNDAKSVRQMQKSSYEQKFSYKNFNFAKQVQPTFVETYKSISFRQKLSLVSCTFEKQIIMYQSKAPLYLFLYNKGKVVIDNSKCSQYMRSITKQISLKYNPQAQFGQLRLDIMETIEILNNKKIEVYPKTIVFTINQEYQKYLRNQKSLKDIAVACNETCNFFSSSIFKFINHCLLFLFDQKIEEYIALIKPMLNGIILNYFFAFGNNLKNIEQIYKYLDYEQFLNYKPGDILMIPHFLDCTLQHKQGSFTKLIIQISHQDTEFITFSPYATFQKGKVILIPFSKILVTHVLSYSNYNQIYARLLNDQGLCFHLYQQCIEGFGQKSREQVEFRLQMKYHQQRLKNNKTSNNSNNKNKDLRQTYYNLAFLSKKLKKNKDALSYLEEYIRLSKIDGVAQSVLFSQQLLTALIGLYIKQEQLIKALDLSQKLQTNTSKKYGDNSEAMLQLKNKLGQIYSQFGESTKQSKYQDIAIKYLDSCLKIIKGMNLMKEPIVCKIFFNMGKANQRKNQLQQGIKFYELSQRAINKSMTKNKDKLKLLLALANIYDRSGSGQSSKKQSLQKCKQYLLRAELVSDEVYGKQHAQSLHLYYVISQVFKKLNDHDKYFEYRKKGLRKQ